MNSTQKDRVRSRIEAVPDFPKAGVVYFDFTPILADPGLFRQSVTSIKDHFQTKNITKIAAIEAKGFLLGAALAYEMETPLVLIRKPELSPGEVDTEPFEKEYGFAEYQLKKGAVHKTDIVLIVYDIMAGPGATKAAINLIGRAGAKVAGCAYAIELDYLKGREALSGLDIFSLVQIQHKPELCQNST